MKRLLAGLVLALLIASPVAATSGTIALASANPALGSVVTFSVTVERKFDCVGSRRCARVSVFCYQAGVLVYGEAGDLGQARGDGTSPLGYNGFLLGGGASQWLTNGGPADCVADLFRFDYAGGQTYVPIATTSFAAGG